VLLLEPRLADEREDVRLLLALADLGEQLRLQAADGGGVVVELRLRRADRAAGVVLAVLAGGHVRRVRGLGAAEALVAVDPERPRRVAVAVERAAVPLQHRRDRAEARLIGRGAVDRGDRRLVDARAPEPEPERAEQGRR